MSIILDQMNRTIKVAYTPQRIVSVVPSQTELLFDLGLGERVIGITKFCIHPNHWYRNKKRVGGTKRLNIELIKELKPDLIIGNKEENTAADILELEKHFPVWMSDIFILEDVYSMIESLGSLLDVRAQSVRIKNEIATSFSNFTLHKSLQKKWKTLYFIWKNPYMIAADDTFINNILEIGGFENAAIHLDRYPALTETQLIELRPELIFPYLLLTAKCFLGTGQDCYTPLPTLRNFV